MNQRCLYRGSDAFVNVILLAAIVLFGMYFPYLSYGQQDSEVRSHPEFGANIPDRPHLPKEWRVSPFNAEATALPDWMKYPAKQRVDQILKKYPGDVLKKNLDNCILVGRLHMYGEDAGGANWKRDVYIAVATLLFSHESALERAVHHEISSILMWNHIAQFPMKQWKELNDPDFHYSTDHKEVETDVAFNEAEAEKGFICAYSRSSLENDFNIVVENLFVSSNSFKTIIMQHKIIRAKSILAARFLMSIDARFLKSFDPTLTKDLDLANSATPP